MAEDGQPVTSVHVFLIPAEELASLEGAALNGSGAAAFRLSRHYAFVARDPKIALYWMTIAAQSGFPPAYYDLGFLLLTERNEQSRLRARYWLERATAEADDARKALAAELLREMEKNR
jgi:TPR repeat protein